MSGPYLTPSLVRSVPAWRPIETAPEGVRVLLGPRRAPVVGVVRYFRDSDTGDVEPSCSVVHYNGNILVAGYHCSEWSPIQQMEES